MARRGAPARGFRIVVAEARLSPERPWHHVALEVDDRPFDWLHVHEALELGICHAGRGEWIVGDQRLPFAAGTVVVIAPGVPHFGSSAPGTRSRWEFLMVEPTLLIQGPQSGREVLDASGLSGRGFPAMLDPRRHPDACAVVREAIAEAGRRLAGQDAAVRGLCWAALARLRRLPGARKPAGDARLLPSLRPALERMARTAQPTPGVGELAALCRLSERTLRRRFHAALGMSTAAWLGRNRILRAAERLRDPRVSVTRAASEAGFGSTSGFTRRFLAVMAMSPRAWRRRAGAEGARS